MAEWLASGRLIDGILLIVLIEAAAISFYWAKTGKGIAPRDVLPNLIAGACLLVALRLALTGSDWPPVCAALALSGVASALDLARRWR
jgi:hypothetical protein